MLKYIFFLIGCTYLFLSSAMSGELGFSQETVRTNQKKQSNSRLDVSEKFLATKKKPFSKICQKSASNGNLVCDDYPGDLRVACHNGVFNPNNGRYYDLTLEPVCDSLKGDLAVACYNGAIGVVTCDDYPGDIKIACYNEVLNPFNGKFYKKLDKLP